MLLNPSAAKTGSILKIGFQSVARETLKMVPCLTAAMMSNNALIEYHLIKHRILQYTKFKDVL